ncbi:hypothetical protein [Paenibacillus thiaminolyticus]|uniref:alpha/beta hydrolase n=1 Tax=Paenibacillus thiaminolyticus TaxID=49283 RepID=UPI002175E2AD|nr:hypothetical protein [Paenibacillus thiaminolyticus]
MMRIGAFAVFVMFTLASVIEWSFRWMGIGLLLLVWAVLGVRALMRSKEERQQYRCGRMVKNAFAMLVLIAMAASPALVFPQYALPQVTGEYQVASVSYTYMDKNRIEQFTGTGENRVVNVGFWYPDNADGTYPLVVFSHGAYGINGSNASTYTELASHGYVVCSIDHPYHSFYTASVDGTVALVNSEYMQEVNNSNKGVSRLRKPTGLFKNG